MCKVSIVVPVYNVERYLRACMESLVNQTLQDIEIIVVNDGSPDNSIVILEEYERQYAPKVKVYTIENHGVSYARNYGAELAKGDYILFVDSDDYIDLTMCEVLYEKAMKDGNDVVLCGKTDFYESNAGKDAERVLSLEHVSQNFTIEERPFELCQISPLPWDKLIKRELFLKVKFPVNMRFEDMCCILKMICLAESIGVVNEPLYHYRRTTTGGFLNTFSEGTLDVIRAFDDIMQFMREHGFDKKYHDELTFACATRFFFRYPALFKERKKNYKLKKRMIKETQQFMTKHFPDWKNNHYIKYSYRGSIRKNLWLYTSQWKMSLAVAMFNYIPSKLWWILERTARKGSRFLKALKTQSKIKVLKKSLKFLKVFRNSGNYLYTKAYEKCSVDKQLILLESKHGEDIAGNIFNMLRTLQEPEYQNYRILLGITEEIRPRFQELVKIYQLKNVEPVLIGSKEYYRALASAGYLATDTSFPTCYIKKDEQVYLNTWHGTPLKGMGRTVPGREFGLGNIQRNYFISDILLYQNEFSRDIFLDDYMIRNIYNGEVMLSGYPRNGALYNVEIYDKIRKENDLEGMQLIAYMPTWRGVLHENNFDEQVKEIYRYLTDIDKLLNDRQVFFVKLHPFVGTGINYSSFRHIRPFISSYDTYDFLNATDMLLTDYSSIMFDYAVTGKKIILFAYDREEYLANRGMYLDLNEVEFPVVESVEELVKEFDRPNAGYPKFQERFCSYDSKDSSKAAVTALLEYKAEENKEKKEKNVLLYLDQIGNRKVFQKAIRDINGLANDDVHYYICFKATAAKKNTDLLSELDPRIGYIPVQGNEDILKMEQIARWMYMNLGWINPFTRKKVNRLNERLVKQFFGNIQFDLVMYYHGTSLMNLKSLSPFTGKKICNLMEFSKSEFEEKQGYRSAVTKMITGESGFEVFCINEAFQDTALYQKTKHKVKYCVMPADQFDVGKLMEV